MSCSLGSVKNDDSVMAPSSSALRSRKAMTRTRSSSTLLPLAVRFVCTSSKNRRAFAFTVSMTGVMLPVTSMQKTMSTA